LDYLRSAHLNFVGCVLNGLLIFLRDAFEAMQGKSLKKSTAHLDHDPFVYAAENI
jgi:hypothetical protein